MAGALALLQPQALVSSTHQDGKQVQGQVNGLPFPTKVHKPATVVRSVRGVPLTLPISVSRQASRPSSSSSWRLQASMKVATQSLSIKDVGVVSNIGLGRVRNEDTKAVFVEDPETGKPSFFGVFDGHGGVATADYVAKNLWACIQSNLKTEEDPIDAIFNSYLQVDKAIITPPKGLFGAFQEAGIGGAKCGSTAVSAVILPQKKADGTTAWRLITANVGDSRAVLIRNQQPIQMSALHTPDVEEERIRIEAKNPTPNKPLVYKAGGVWRVGGLLALSRAFGDVYLKNRSGETGKYGGFGLVAEPDIFDDQLGPGDEWLILASDGLWDYVSLEKLVEVCNKHKTGENSPRLCAEELQETAIDCGSEDDVTVVAVRLPFPPAASAE